MKNKNKIALFAALMGCCAGDIKAGTFTNYVTGDVLIAFNSGGPYNLVVDAGPDVHNYDIDITVSFPANGKFTPRQREIYEACNAVHEACMKTYRPGLTGAQCDKEVREILIKKGFNPDSELMKQFGGGFGHYVGLAVHDVGGGPSVLKPGMVFANEPLAVFAKEKLGVRIEDTVVITENGCENLTAGLPRTVEEIEKLMKEK